MNKSARDDNLLLIFPKEFDGPLKKHQTLKSCIYNLNS